MTNAKFESPESALEYYKKFAVNGSGFSKFMRVQPIKVWQGEAELSVDIRDDMTQHHGFVHGAIVGFMADNACAWAAGTIAGDVVTGNYNINFLAPALGEKLRSMGKVIKAGKRQIVTHSEVYAATKDAEPKLVAVAQATIIPIG